MFRSLLVGVDGAAHTAGVIAAAADLARACGACVHILCVVDPAYFVEEPPDGRPSRADEIEYPAASVERESADALLREAIARFATQGIGAQGMVMPGEPVPAIVETARKLGSDLIVLGHRHLCWLGRLTGRSVCADILEAAPCPVLVIPAPGTEAK